MTRKLKERISAGIVALGFLVTFGGVGALGIWAVVATLYDGVRARSWVAVPATITHVDAGQVAYAYEWKQATYSGNRAGTFILGGSSDLDDWDERIDAMIARAVAEDKTVTVYLNPDDPGESLLDREIRWKLLGVFFPVAFVFAAVGFIAAFLIGRKAVGWRESGARVPLLKPRARDALTQWAVGLAWNAGAFPIALLAIPELWAKGEWFPVILLLLFPSVGLMILWAALQTTAAVFREGSPFNARTAS